MAIRRREVTGPKVVMGPGVFLERGGRTRCAGWADCGGGDKHSRLHTVRVVVVVETGRCAIDNRHQRDRDGGC
jgi:hypothetical protein